MRRIPIKYTIYEQAKTQATTDNSKIVAKFFDELERENFQRAIPSDSWNLNGGKN